MLRHIIIVADKMYVVHTAKPSMQTVIMASRHKAFPSDKPTLSVPPFLIIPR